MIRLNFKEKVKQKSGHLIRREETQHRYAHIDWSMPNVDIARKMGVSRERVRQLRNNWGKPPVESRGALNTTRDRKRNNSH